MSDSRSVANAVRSTSAWMNRDGRSRLIVEGPERSAFLHNLTTQDINGLVPGQGAEAFVTSPQGKTLAHVSVHSEPDRLWLRSDPGLAHRIGAHLDKYGLFNDARWSDISNTTREWHVCGPGTASFLKTLGCVGAESETPPGIERTTIADVPVVLIHENPAGVNGWTVITEESGSARLEQVLKDSGLPEIDPVTWEALRIEAGTLVDGQDVTVENLPQELDRDSRTISFRKGCYLGQETVARLDALGHVNRILRGFLLSPGLVPAPGTALIGPDARPVGRITSAAQAPDREGPIALGFVRTRFEEPGTNLRVESGPEGRIATVVTLPMNREGG